MIDLYPDMPQSIKRLGVNAPPMRLRDTVALSGDGRKVYESGRGTKKTPLWLYSLLRRRGCIASSPALPPHERGWHHMKDRIHDEAMVEQFHTDPA